jgi:hypothetical protein
MSNISIRPGVTVVPNWSTSATVSRAALRTAADRNLHQRIVPKIVVIDRILMAAGDRHDARRHHLDHLVLDMVGIAAVRHRLRQQPAHTDITLRLPQQQCTAIGRLIAAFEIDGEFLATDGGQIKRKRRIVSHSGCGAGLIREATLGNTSLLCESGTFRNRRLRNSHSGD